jgi:hypothetical protein
MPKAPFHGCQRSRYTVEGPRHSRVLRLLILIVIPAEAGIQDMFKIREENVKDAEIC